MSSVGAKWLYLGVVLEVVPRCCSWGLWMGVTQRGYINGSCKVVLQSGFTKPHAKRHARGS